MFTDAAAGCRRRTDGRTDNGRCIDVPLLHNRHLIAPNIMGFIRPLLYSVQLLYNGKLRNPTITLSIIFQIKSRCEITPTTTIE